MLCAYVCSQWLEKLSEIGSLTTPPSLVVSSFGILFFCSGIGFWTATPSLETSSCEVRLLWSEVGSWTTEGSLVDSSCEGRSWEIHSVYFVLVTELQKKH